VSVSFLRRRLHITVNAFARFVVCLFATWMLIGCNSSSQPFDLSKATYVGRSTCIQCHRDEDQKWIGSHHDQAMQLANDISVLADFNNATLTHHGVTSRMFRDGKRFMVNTEGPDGQMHDFEVKYVFGVDPLQQYMVEFDRESSIDDSILKTQYAADLPRIQVLRLCWNTQKKEWFHLDPPDVSDKLEPSDDLHWTGVAQRWNNMCAECHSTDYKKNFTAPSANASKLVSSKAAHSKAEPARGEYHSTFSEINVSCEGCHGPGSVHVELSKKWFPGWNRKRGYGLANLKLSAENQIQACAPCHSRRNIVQSGFQAGDDYYDFYSNQLLVDPVYYPDGQILDEDYVHGSFIQSKMYHKGIRCTDCHDPHTAKVKQDGNQLCTSCHQHPAAKYDSVAHHFHKVGSEGAKCVNCHMPTTTYMGVHARHDHSLRIPRPNLSLQIGTPNACTGCHLKPENVAEPKRSKLKLYQDWMAAARSGDEEVKAELQRADKYSDQACDKWYGAARRRDEHFGTAIAAGQSGSPDAEKLIRRLLTRKGFEAPAIARATALQVLSQVAPGPAAEEAFKLINDDHPLVRAAAASVLVGSDSQTAAVGVLEKALKDPVRCVRTEAARSLLEFPRRLLSESSATPLRAAIDELEKGLLFNNDRAGAHMTLGNLAEQQGRNQSAIDHYRDAIAVEPSVTGPRSNLASLLERNLQSQSTLSSNVVESITAQVNQLRKDELPLLKRDVDLLPTAAGIQYRYGLSLYIDGQKELAAKHLLKAAELEPRQPQYAQAAAMALEAVERWDEASHWAKVTLELTNNAQENQLLLQRIQNGKPK
jgi:predicted CXXCH cytochrome family protein